MMGGRRRLLTGLAAGLAYAATGGVASALGDRTKVRLARLRLPGLSDDPVRGAVLERLAFELNLRTSVDTSYRVPVVTGDGPDLFDTPFLFLAGATGFAPLSEPTTRNLRRHLELGGVLLVDDTSGLSRSPFDASVRELARTLFPEQPLQRLPDDHSIFRSYYLLRRLGGRTVVSPFLEGATIEDRTPLIYCRNDLSGAWARDHRGQWAFDCSPGGEAQRQQAVALGVNAVLYALTVNYKQDQIHLPFIRERMRL